MSCTADEDRADTRAPDRVIRGRRYADAGSVTRQAFFGRSGKVHVGTRAYWQSVLDEALAEAIFRANRQFELVPFDRLNAGDKPAADVTDRTKMYGILRPTTPHSTVSRYVSADLALLFYTLREPGRLPNYFVGALNPSLREMLAELVTDGMLEIEVDGVFTSGPRGLGAMLDSSILPRAWSTDARSAAALRFAFARGGTDVREMAAQLYLYHRIAANARWRAQLADPAGIERFLGIRDRCAIELRSVAGWYCWTSPLGAATCRYKLYVSPQPSALRETVAAVAGAARYGARALKIGGDIYNLLRPDKVVIYFTTFEALAEAARHLGRELATIPAHGVPFTAAFGSSGLLSWGVDGFGHNARTSPLMSWRQWVTLRIAAALASAMRRTPADDDAVWAFIHRQLALDGVNADTWTPVAALHGGSAVAAT